MCSCSLFFHCCSFSPLATSISHFLNAATNFSCCPSKKECLLCFSSLALALFHSFSHWASLACRQHVLSLFLCLSISLYSKLWTCKTSLILLDNTDTVVSASWDTDGYEISRQNNLELHFGCHKCTCWLSYFTLVCLWCRQKDMRLRDYQNFSEGKITTFS